MKKYLLHITFVFFACTLFGQAHTDQLKTDLELASARMKEMLPAVIHSSYTLYATHDTSGIMSNANGQVYLTSSTYYQSIKGVHIFIEGNQVAIIDEDEKTIVIDEKEIDLQELIFNVNIEQLPELIQSIEMEEDLENRTYDLVLNPYSSFQKVKLSISKRSNLISRLELYYANSQGLENTLQEEETPRLVIDIVTKSLNGKTSYSLNKNPFFVLSNNELTLKPNYSTYSIINNLNSNE